MVLLYKGIPGMFGVDFWARVATIFGSGVP
jgi:hypothetical protein